jgi:arylsulfatase A-like enzyme
MVHLLNHYFPLTILNRKLKTALIIIMGGVLLCSCKTKHQNLTNVEPKPNVLFINVDDLGWKDVGFMGSKWFDTPNLDQFAKEGIVFTQAYAAAANCAPSRACLMTGQYTPHHGIFTVGNPARGDERTRKLIPARNKEDLPEHIMTLGGVFKEAGYITGTFGKWHLGPEPLNQGFDINVGGGRPGAPGKGGYFAPYSIPYIEDGPKGEYLTERLTDEVINFITRNKDMPFFAYLPFYTVHTPLQPKEDLFEKYKNKEGIINNKQAKYGAMVEAMDTNVGRILKKLDALGLRENTIVVFTSDNGGIRSVSPQDPLRAGKGSYFEGGIRVPMVIRWPGKVEAGAETAHPTINMDFFPTFRDILGVKVEKELDGESLLPVLSGQPAMHERPLFWHFPIYLQAYNPNNDDGRDPLFRTRPGSAIRKGKWKLHDYFEDNKILLYDLECDPGERKNVADEYPEVVEELYVLLNDWREKSNAPVNLEPNPAYDPAYENDKIGKIISKL